MELTYYNEDKHENTHDKEDRHKEKDVEEKKEINNTYLDDDNDDIDFTDKYSSRLELMFAGLIVFLVGSGLIIKYV
jgi:hypothetical protein